MQFIYELQVVKYTEIYIYIYIYIYTKSKYVLLLQYTKLTPCMKQQSMLFLHSYKHRVQFMRWYNDNHVDELYFWI